MELRTFTQNMLRLASPGGVSRAFEDFLEVAIVLNSADRDESLRKLLVCYDKQERYLMMEAYASLVLEMAGDGSGLVDVLGEFYSQYVNIGYPLTSQVYCDMLPGLLQADFVNYRVADYRCRTGRRLLAAAKFNRGLRFFGADPDSTMCRITLLNLCLNGLFGEVALYDVRRDVYFETWSVDLDYKGKPCIRKLKDEKSLLFQKRGSLQADTTRLIFDY